MLSSNTEYMKYIVKELKPAEPPVWSYKILLNTKTYKQYKFHALFSLAKIHISRVI